MQQCRILLIDDDEDEHYIFKEALRTVNNSHQYSGANGWQQAENLLLFTKPDFIFVDMNMPGKNGIECLKEIKKKNELELVPVYLYSTGISDTECRKALNMGAKDCIKKTSTITELSNLLSNILFQQPTA